MDGTNDNTNNDIPYLYRPEYIKLLEQKQECQKQAEEIMATIQNLSSLDQWNALYETQIWRINWEYTREMMLRYGHVNTKIRLPNRPLPKMADRFVTSDSEHESPAMQEE